MAYPAMNHAATAAVILLGIVLMLSGFRRYIIRDVWRSKQFRLSLSVLMIAAGTVLCLASAAGLLITERNASATPTSDVLPSSQSGKEASVNMTVVPNVTEMEQAEAVRVLAERGLDFKVWWTEENNVNAHRRYVASQSVPAESSVPEGTVVELELYVKSEDILPNADGETELLLPDFCGTDAQGRVKVPDVVGLDQEEAAARIQACGLEFQVWWEEEKVSDIYSDIYYVIRQSIPAESLVPVGTQVDLWLSVQKNEK